VQQRILGVVRSVLYCFIINLSDLPAVKELWKLVTIWRNHRYNGVAHLSETQCSSGHNPHL